MHHPIFGMINVLFSFSSGKIQEGDPVGDLTLWHETSGHVQVSDFKGSWLVLYFYPKANTPGCTQEALTYNELIPEFHEASAEVIGISTDSEAKHQQFQDKKGLNLRFVSDPDGVIAKAFGVKIMLGMCARDTVLVNPDCYVDTIYKGVDPKANAREVLAYLKDQNLIRQTKNT